LSVSSIISLNVTSMAEYMDAIELAQEHFRSEMCSICEELRELTGGGCIHSPNGQPTDSPVWFRGHEKASYMLLPSAYRSEEIPPKDGWKFNGTHLNETTRDQAFRARTYHLMEKMPETSLEWEEVRQHFRSKTKALDWSESAYHALAFAMESLLDPDQKSIEVLKRRQSLSPLVWLLNPRALNVQVYLQMRNNTCYIRMAEPERKLRFALRQSFLQKRNFILPGMCHQPYSAGLLSLSVLNAQRMEYGSSYRQRLLNRELNPFYHLLLRYYADALPIEFGPAALPPMATLAPYHSRRIIAQRGVLSIYPNYAAPNTPDLKLPEKLRDPRALEHFNGAEKFLARIHIIDPERVSHQLRMTGINKTSLYPEAEIFAQDVEFVPP